MPRERRPSDDVWDALAAHFPSMTRSEKGMIGKVQRELLEIGALPEEIDLVCAWVKRKFDPVTVMAVPKWWSTALTEASKIQTSTIEEVMRQWTENR